MASLSLDVPLELIKDPRTWTVDDISLWLQWLGIGEHLDAFAARGVDGQALLQLGLVDGSGASWAELGVSDAAQQRVLDSAVEPLRCFREESTESGLALHAIEGPVAGEVFFVGAGGITGGRHSASNGVVLSENYVSRRHFQITRDRTPQFFLQDVGSTTGTFLMVREGLQLDHLVVLQLGTTEVTVYISEDCQCTLVATEGPDKDARAVVPPQGIFVGREASNGFCVRDPQVSAFHAEVRYAPDQGFILDDKYSTNRTWLRLSPDGQASRNYPLRVGDLFKVGSTLFHVIDPTSAPDADSAFTRPGVLPDRRSVVAASHLPARPASRGDAGGVAPTSDEDLLRPTVPALAPTPVGGRGSLRAAPQASEEEPESDPASPQPPSSAVLDGTGTRLPSVVSVDDGSGQPPPPPLRWEPFVEGEARPQIPPDEYARRVTASRRRMHTVGSAWLGASGGDGARVNDMQERELSSMQQQMRNSRAQTAYSLQERRQPERRDEDLCKICYDHDIDVVLYPCGHFVLCRWCAQKVSDCPVCRLVITDVIRTYKA